MGIESRGMYKSETSESSKKFNESFGESKHQDEAITKAIAELKKQSQEQEIGDLSKTAEELETFKNDIESKEGTILDKTLSGAYEKLDKKNKTELSDVEWIVKNEAIENNLLAKLNNTTDPKRKIVLKRALAMNRANKEAQENKVANLTTKQKPDEIKKDADKMNVEMDANTIRLEEVDGDKLAEGNLEDTFMKSVEDFDPKTGIGLAVPEFRPEMEEDLSEAEKQQVGEKFLEFSPKTKTKTKSEQESKFKPEEQVGVKELEFVNPEEQEYDKETGTGLAVPEFKLEEELSMEEKEQVGDKFLEFSPEIEVESKEELVFSPEEAKKAKESKEGKEKISEKKEKAKEVLNEDLNKSKEDLESKHGKGFVNKCKEFLRVSWGRDKYQIKNLAKIIGGATLMAASPLGTFAAPFIYGAGIKFAAEGTVGAIGWMRSKERKELNKAYSDLHNIKKLSLSKDPKELEKISKESIKNMNLEARNKLNEAKEKAGFKQKTIDVWGKRIAAVAGVVGLFTGIPMDLDLDGTTHAVRIGKEGLRFAIDNTSKLLQMDTVQVLRYAGEMGAYALPFLAGLRNKMPKKPKTVSNIKKVDEYKSLKKEMEGLKSRETSFEVKDKEKARSVAENVGKLNHDFAGNKIEEEPEKEKVSVKIEDKEELTSKWSPSGNSEIDDFVANVEFAQNQTDNVMKIGVLRKGLEDSIHKNLNVWEKDIRTTGNLSLSEKENFVKFQSDLKKALEYSQVTIKDPRILRFLAIDDKNFEEYEKEVMGTEKEQNERAKKNQEELDKQ